MRKYHFIGIPSILIYIFIFSGCIDNDTKSEIEKVTINFNEELKSSSSYNNYTKEMQTMIINEIINTKNLTRIEFILTWIDDAPGWAGDEFNLSIEDPNEAIVNFTPSNSIQLEDSEGEIKIIATINVIPKNTTINKNQVETFLNTTETKNGCGEWKIKISCINAYYAGDITPIFKDKGNNWNLTIKMFIYKSTIEN